MITKISNLNVLFQAKVLEVINGDALTIRDLRDNKVKKIYLSSVRAPRATDLQQKNDENNGTNTCEKSLIKVNEGKMMENTNVISNGLIAQWLNNSMLLFY